MTAPSLTHWHVGTGFTGYGPDSDDGFDSIDSVIGAAASACCELSGQIDYMHDTAEAYAAEGDYQRAWETHKLSNEFDTLTKNLDIKRADAPLYRGDAESWTREVTRLIGEQFPLSLDVEDGRRLYIWECNDDC